MISPKPLSSLLDVVHHCLGVGMYCVFGDGQAHVGVDSIFRRVWE